MGGRAALSRGGGASVRNRSCGAGRFSARLRPRFDHKRTYADGKRACAVAGRRRAALRSRSGRGREPRRYTGGVRRADGRVLRLRARRGNIRARFSPRSLRPRRRICRGISRRRARVRGRGAGDRGFGRSDVRRVRYGGDRRYLVRRPHSGRSAFRRQYRALRGDRRGKRRAAHILCGRKARCGMRRIRTDAFRGRPRRGGGRGRAAARRQRQRGFAARQDRHSFSSGGYTPARRGGRHAAADGGSVVAARFGRDRR